MAKKIYLNKEGHTKLRKGVNLLAECVGSTLGAGGKTVFVAPGYGHMPKFTKDGVTVAKTFFVEDELENAGAFLIRGAASKTVSDCGDGTTTSTVLAQCLINEGLDAIKKQKRTLIEEIKNLLRLKSKKNNVNSREIKSGIEIAVEAVTDKLEGMSVAVDSTMIESVATISANNDAEIGKKIGEAYSKIGKNGLLTIQDSGTIETYIKVVEGAEMIRGFDNEKFATNLEKMLVEYESPLILVVDYEIKTLKELLPLIQDLQKKEVNLAVTPLVIIARGYEGEPYNTLLGNKINNGMKICLLNAPASYQKEALTDVAAIVGAKLISDDNGVKVEHATVSDLGTCKKFVSSKYSTTFQEGGGKKEDIELIKKQIEKQIEETDNSQLKEILEKRGARLCGNIGIIYVGGATDMEREERKDRVDDANRAVKSAMEEGVVAGGGVALIRCIYKLDVLSHLVSEGERIGVNIVKKACEAPLRKMLENASLPESIIEEVKNQKNETEGYDVLNKRFVDMFESNILDPKKVVRCALQNASSIACQLIDSSVLMIEMKPE